MGFPTRPVEKLFKRKNINAIFINVNANICVEINLVGKFFLLGKNCRDRIFCVLGMEMSEMGAIVVVVE